MSSIGTTDRSAPVDLRALRAEVEELGRAEHAPATQRAYAADWADFSDWCVAAGLDALLATADTVALFVADRARRLRPATIARRLAAISAEHRTRRLVDPVRSEEVRAVTAGVRRRLGTRQVGKAALSVELLRRMVAALGDDLAGSRDAAVLVVGFAGAFRRSELVALRVPDLERHERGLLVTIRRSKTDQSAKGRTVALPRLGGDLCPVAAIERWLDRAHITHGPLLRSVDRHGTVGESLAPASVGLVVKRAAARLGIDPAPYGAHSLRAGFVTAAVGGGASELLVAATTGHRSIEVLRRYLRPADPFDASALSLAAPAAFSTR